MLAIRSEPRYRQKNLRIGVPMRRELADADRCFDERARFYEV